MGKNKNIKFIMFGGLFFSTLFICNFRDLCDVTTVSIKYI